MNLETWFADLEAERVTHSRETAAQLNRRLMLERPDTPYQALVRRRHDERAQQYRRIEQLRSME